MNGGAFTKCYHHTCLAFEQIVTLCCRLLRLPVASARASEQQLQEKQPLQDANGRHATPQLLPAPSLPPPQPQPQASHLTLHSNANTLRSNEPASINVGSIANAYFAPVPGADGMSLWGRSQYGPAQEASQAAALGGHPGFGGLHSPAAVSQSTNPRDSFPTRGEAGPFVSNYMNGIPWEADTAALRLHPSSQQQQQLGSAGGVMDTCGDSSNAVQGHKHAMATSSKPAHSSGESNASSHANSKHSRGCRNNQQAAEAVGRRPRAAANSPKTAVREAEADGSRRVQPARSPPRYHQPRYALTLLLLWCHEPFGTFQETPSAMPLRVVRRAASAALSSNGTECLPLEAVVTVQQKV